MFAKERLNFLIISPEQDFLSSLLLFTLLIHLFYGGIKDEADMALLL